MNIEHLNSSEKLNHLQSSQYLPSETGEVSQQPNLVFAMSSSPNITTLRKPSPRIARPEFELSGGRMELLNPRYAQCNHDRFVANLMHHREIACDSRFNNLSSLKPVSSGSGTHSPTPNQMLSPASVQIP